MSKFSFGFVGAPETDDVEKAADDTSKNGEDALKRGGKDTGHDPSDFARSIFGSIQMPKRGKDRVRSLKVSLEDLYLGTTKRRSVSRNVLCPVCNGKGSLKPDPLMDKCSGCQGTKRKVTIKELPRTLLHQVHPCNDCRCTGETINERDQCPHCRGKHVIRERKVLEISVEKGMRDGQKITFSGESDEAPETVTGDIVITLQQEEHPKFKRKGDDLFFEHTLSLTEALCGFQVVLSHLDGRRLLIKSQPGEVMKPDTCKSIDDEGMPVYQRPFMKGILYIRFKVEFPDSISPDHIVLKILPPKPQTDMELDDCREVDLNHVVNIDEDVWTTKEASHQPTA